MSEWIKRIINIKPTKRKLKKGQEVQSDIKVCGFWDGFPFLSSIKVCCDQGYQRSKLSVHAGTIAKGTGDMM